MRNDARLWLPLVVLSGCVAPAATVEVGKPASKPAAGGKPPATTALGASAGRTIVDAGAGILGNNGASLISDKGLGLVGKAKGPASLISNNGGSLATGYALLGALVQVPVPDAPVTLLDAAGALVSGADGRPLQTRTDASGGFQLTGFGVARNLVVAVTLPAGKGRLLAIAHPGTEGRAVELDVASTLTTGFVLDEVAKGRQAILDRLAPDAASRLTAQALAGLEAGAVTLPAQLNPEDVKRAVAALRQQAPALDGAFKQVADQLAAPPGSPAPTASALGATSPSTAPTATPPGTAATASPAASPSPTPGTVQVIAGGTSGYVDAQGTSARFNVPYGVAADQAGNLFIADSGNNRIRKVSPAGEVSTVAGNGTYGYADGPGATAMFALPKAIAVDGAGTLYVADSGPDSSSQRIRKITAAGQVSTLAGTGEQGYVDGPGTGAKFFNSEGITVDGTGTVFVVESNNHVRKISPAGVVSTWAGSTQGFADGPGASALFAVPYGITSDGLGNVFVVDTGNNRIRRITAAGVVSTLAGNGGSGFVDGPAATAQFDKPRGIAVDRAGNLYVADSANVRIRKVTPAGEVSTFAVVTGWRPYGVTIDAQGYLYFTDQTKHAVLKWTAPTSP